MVNTFVKENNVQSVIEFGCGDGNQLSLSSYPKYIGLDVSRTAVKTCISRFKGDKTKSFFLYDPECFADYHALFKAELGLSLDVIYHLTEHSVFSTYMRHLFDSSSRFVIIYSSNTEGRPAPHVRHRRFTSWIEAHAPGWVLL